MIQYKVFVGTIEEVEGDFNAYLAGLRRGANVNAGPLVKLEDGQYIKEATTVLPEASGLRPAAGRAIIERVPN